jgi:carotenoid cleavage dioxygenase-like enzyme
MDTGGHFAAREQPQLISEEVRAGCEGEDYLLATVYRSADNRSDLAVFEAEAVERGPVAIAELSHRVPFGFHGN